MKYLASIAAIFLATAATAEAPAHFAVAGCDTATMVAVTNAAGEVLYWTNANGGGCNADRGDTGAAYRAVFEAEERARLFALENAED